MTTDDAFDRLRAADPATGTRPDLGAIRAGLVAATGLPLTGLVEHDELAARRRRRTEWWRAAAAVVAVAVVGTGGYLASAHAGAGSTTAGSALPAISLDGTAGTVGGAPAASPAKGTAAGAAASSDAAVGAARGTAVMPWYGAGRTVFTGKGLSTAAGSATAWAFDASAVASAQTAARIAASLGVAGTPRVQWGSWVVGPNDGTGPTVTLDGQGNLSYNDPARDPWQCQAGSGSAEGGTVGSGSAEGGTVGSGSAGAGTLVAPAPPVASAPSSPGVASAPSSAGVSSDTVPAPSPLPGPADPTVCVTGGTPTGDAAIARARAALTTVGVDSTGAQAQVDDSNVKGTGGTGAAYVFVSFQQVVDGRLTGVSWNVALVGDGVLNLSGPIAPLVSLGSYDVISPAAAVDRLNDPRFGASGGMVYPMGAATASDAVASAPYPVASPNPDQAPVIPPAPQAGAAISWPVQHVTLVSAQLGVASIYQESGAQVLVPAYSLTDTTGATWSVVAVVDAQLDFGTK